MFLPQLPATVASTKEHVGKAIGSPAVTLTYGSVVIDATLTPAQGYLIEPGDRATVRLGSHLLVGVVRSVKRSVRAREASAKIALRAVAAHAHIGSQVTVSIDAQASAARTLAVPIGALYASGDGSAYVIVSGRGLRHVPVNVGQAVGGMSRSSIRQLSCCQAQSWCSTPVRATTPPLEVPDLAGRGQIEEVSTERRERLPACRVLKARCRTRTDNRLITSEVRYQLRQAGVAGEFPQLLGHTAPRVRR